jgi:hypothetical protein
MNKKWCDDHHTKETRKLWSHQRNSKKGSFVHTLLSTSPLRLLVLWSPPRFFHPHRQWCRGERAVVQWIHYTTARVVHVQLFFFQKNWLNCFFWLILNRKTSSWLINTHFLNETCVMYLKRLWYRQFTHFPMISDPSLGIVSSRVRPSFSLPWKLEHDARCDPEIVCNSAPSSKHFPDPGGPGHGWTWNSS